ncbi:MAG: hypothetical protein B1H11_05055 [Desulfobacteraceae bacterium 4484_190.1]|nr:MAG: hypothetical protein B1H11_05055 [Desulfobacteraceae bacterium 4484_190.1]
MATIIEEAYVVYDKLMTESYVNQDILIAGICITQDLPLFTRNTAHFLRISRLKLFNLCG